MAHCLDVRTESPRHGDRFFLDTSAALYIVYSALSMSRIQQERASSYAAFIELCARRGAEVFWSPLSFSEMAHAIERHLWRSHSPNEEINVKQFRAIGEERKRVVSQISAAWTQMSRLGTCLEQKLDAGATDSALKRLGASLLDGYDLFYVDAMHARGLSCIIADDSDFDSLTHFIVYTANKNVLR
jgi:predicted nucleic acid-binding protein